MQTLHRARNKKNKYRIIKPGQSIAEAAISYRNAIKEFNKAQQDYMDVKGNDENERKLHLKTIAKDKADQTGGSTTSHLNQLLHIEGQRKTNRRIKRVLKPNLHEGITHVLVPARSAYGNQDTSFDHYHVDTMWNLIYPDNGKGTNNGKPLQTTT